MRMKVVIPALLVLGLALAALAVYTAKDREHRPLDTATREVLGGDYADLPDGVTFYRWNGPEDGKVVLLLHGGTVPHWGFTSLAAQLAGHGYRVLRYDMYGRGWSDRPDTVYDRALYNTQLAGLLDKLGVEGKVDIIGTSFGGAVGAVFAASYPERVRSLSLVSPVVTPVDNPTVALLQIPVIGEFLLRTIGLDRIERRAQGFFARSDMAPQMDRLFAAQMEYYGFERSLLSFARHAAVDDYTDAYERLGRTGIPTLLMWGDRDEDIPRSAIDAARAALPDVDYHEFAGADHALMLDRPEETLGLILNQLGN
jgi:pimeloyl-ACP methyl ester carboxylesterase